MSSGFVTGIPRLILRVEGVAAFSMSLFLYRQFSRWLGPVRCSHFLIPDLSMPRYLVGPRIGAIIYNAAHSYTGPTLFVARHHSRSAARGRYSRY